MPLAVATGRVRIKGSVSKVLEFVPRLQPAFDRYSEVAASHGCPPDEPVHAFDGLQMGATTSLFPGLDNLPEDMDLFRAAVRAFVDEHVRPKVEENDRAPADEMDWDLVRAGHDMGLLRLVVPVEYGGLGRGRSGWRWRSKRSQPPAPARPSSSAPRCSGRHPLLLSGDPQLQARFLPMFAGDEPVLACNAITEDAAGCDLLIPDNAVHAVGVVSARRYGDDYVLNGRKRFITNARFAEFGCVYANLEGHPGATGLTAFMVPLDLPGVERGPVADKMGYRACVGSELIFRDVARPGRQRGGRRGQRDAHQRPADEHGQGHGCRHFHRSRPGGFRAGPHLLRRAGTRRCSALPPPVHRPEAGRDDRQDRCLPPAVHAGG